MFGLQSSPERIGITQLGNPFLVILIATSKTTLPTKSRRPNFSSKLISSHVPELIRDVEQSIPSSAKPSRFPTTNLQKMINHFLIRFIGNKHSSRIEQKKNCCLCHAVGHSPIAAQAPRYLVLPGR
jgi:hypothetical protein